MTSTYDYKASPGRPSVLDRAAGELTPDQTAATLRFLNNVAAAMRAYADEPR